MDRLCVWGPFFKRSIVIKEFSGDSSHVPSAGWPGWSSGPVPGKGPKGKSCQPHLLLVICQPLFHCYHSNLTHSWRCLSQLFETSFMIWSACDALLKLIVFTGVLINVFMLIIWCVIKYIYMFMCVRPITLYGVIIIIVVVVSIIVVSYMIHQGRARALQKEPQLQLRWQSRELIVWGWSGPKAALGQFGFSDISWCALVWMFINVLGQLQRSSRRVGFLWPLNFETSISKPYCEEII